MPIRYKVVSIDRKSCIVTEKEYVLSYPVGKVVKAREDTVGVMCFLTMEDAENFIECNGWLLNQLNGAKIIKVEAIGKGYRLSMLSPGTICYRSVKVLN